MPSTYTQNLGLEKPATGEQAGVWGDTVDSDFDFIDNGIDGSLAIGLSASSYSLTTSPGAQSQGRNKIITWTGTLQAAATVNITPNTAQKIYIMRNATSGGFPINFQAAGASGGGFTLQPGCSAIIFSDGAGPTAQVNGALYDVQLGSVIVETALTVNGPVTFAQAITLAQPTTFNAAVALNAATTVTGALTLNVPGGSNAPYDLYYRSSAGLVTPLPVGQPGQVLEVQTGQTIAWATVGIAIGGTIVGSTPYCVYYSGASNTLAQDASVQITPGVGLGIGGRPQHTLQVGGAYAPEFWMDTSTPGTQQRQICFATSGAPRWLLYTPQQAEPGGNANSNLNMVAYNDAGSASIQVISFWRASGNVSIGIYGDQAAKLAVFGGSNQTTLLVRGTAGQTATLQTWQNSAGTTVASIDPSGNLYLMGSSFLSVTLPSGRLNMYGTVAGSPWGCIHIGPEPNTTSGLNGIRGAIAMEVAPSSGTDSPPANVMRFYFRNNAFVVQYYWNGGIYYNYMLLQGGSGPAQWFVTTNPM